LRIPQDYKEAYRWFEKAQKNTDGVDGLYNLGFMHYRMFLVNDGYDRHAIDAACGRDEWTFAIDIMYCWGVGLSIPPPLMCRWLGH
jgi:TPR repeat protein